MRRFAALLALVTALGAGPACAQVVSNLPNVIAAVADAQLALDAIEAFTQRIFAHRADSAQQAKVEAAIARARSALQVALRAAEGAEKLTQEDIDAAFKAFREAYAALLEVTRPLGVVEGGPALRLGGAELVVPSPLAMTLKVRR